jgi:3-oxoacyl-[acyl-carrier-protein] synthase-1
LTSFGFVVTTGQPADPGQTLGGSGAGAGAICGQAAGWPADCVRVPQTCGEKGAAAVSGEGGERAMRVALETLPEGRKVSYINAHGTSTPVGDVGEIEAVRRVFGQGSTPPVSSTKSMTGHSQGATGASEAVYCLLMLENDFIAPSINVENLDPALNPAEIATEMKADAGLDTIMTNSFGFGGTNGSMLLSKFAG